MKNGRPNNLKVLFLDDMPVRHELFTLLLEDEGGDGWDITHVWSASGAVQELSRDTLWDVVWLDHDLDLVPKYADKVDSLTLARGITLEPRGLMGDTGYSVARWMAEHMEHTPIFVVLHTANPVGRKAMEQVLTGHIPYIIQAGVEETGRVYHRIQGILGRVD